MSVTTKLKAFRARVCTAVIGRWSGNIGDPPIQTPNSIAGWHQLSIIMLHTPFLASHNYLNLIRQMNK